MTREDKRWVISICRILADKMDDSGKVAVEQVISAVESIEEQESCTEITLESAINYLHSIGWMQKHDKELTESAPRVTEFADKYRECGKALGYSLKQMTETRTENKKPGLWLWIYDDDTGSYRCSECCGRGEPNFKFCPHCGSGMMARLHR